MPAAGPLEIRVLPIRDLTPAPYNPRKVLKPTDAAYRKLKASLEEFGLVEPLVWNELTGRVVGGHARLRILTELGVAEVPVSVVRLTEAREKALNVVLNNQEAQGRYDPTKLADVLEELRELPELEMTGYGESTIATLRYEPDNSAALAEPETERVEVTLIVGKEAFSEMEASLDELIQRYDLESHVRRI